MAGLSLLVMHMNATLSESRSMVQVECCADVNDTALMARCQGGAETLLVRYLLVHVRSYHRQATTTHTQRLLCLVVIMRCNSCTSLLSQCTYLRILFRRLFVLRHHCCSSAATSRRHCFSHRTLHHSVWLYDRL